MIGKIINRRTARRPGLLGLALTLALALLLAVTGCASGDDAAAGGGDGGGGGGGSDVGDEEAGIPPGITVRIGDQSHYFETALRASGELDDLPYEIEFKEFLSGPLLAQGFEAGEIDVGLLGDTPASGTVSAGIPVKALTVADVQGPSVFLLARPGIDSVEDLKGKKVAFTTGTAQHAVALRALDSAGLTQDDVEQVDVALQQLGAVLDSGAADASIVGVGDVLRYQEANPDAKVLATSDELEPPSYLYILGHESLLDDEERSPAAYDLVARLGRAWDWVAENPDEWVEAFFVGVTKQTAEFGHQIVENSGSWASVPITDEVQTALQGMVDLLADGGGIPESFDVAPLFDPEVIELSNEALAGKDG